MKKIMLMGLALSAFTSSVAAQAFECPSAGDTCEVNANEMRLDFNGIGATNDTVVLGTLDYVFYRNLVACVNGVVQFGTDPNGMIRDKLDMDSVLCTDGGSDDIRVLRLAESWSCSLAGVPVTLGPMNYNNKELKIHAGSSNDVVRGGQGSDRICGGTGDDRLYGRGGRNELNGGEGNDYIEADTDIDWMFGADGDDIIIDTGTGGFRNDCSVLDPLRMPSRMEGGAGNDCLEVPTSSEWGWCYRQFESCGGSSGVVCHAGLWCGAGGADRIDTDTHFGLGCESRTNGVKCPRK